MKTRQHRNQVANTGTANNTPNLVADRKTRRRRNRTRAIIGSILGTSLATGGVAMALWTADAQLSSGTITTGNLAINMIGQPAYWDVSPDRKDADTPVITNTASGVVPLGHQIDLASWQMVPGDKIAIARQVKLDLHGDNLTAALVAAGLGDGRIVMTVWSFQVFDHATGALIASGDLPVNATNSSPQTLTYFTASAQGAGLSDENAKVHPVDPDQILDVVMYVGLHKDETRTNSANIQQAISAVKLQLNQVRTTGAQFK